MLKYESIFVKPNELDNLHIMNIYEDDSKKEDKTPIFMFHGSMEDGKIFYTLKGKGLAPFLAKAGYDIYVVDKRGRGKSTPSISRKSKYSQKEVLIEDIPAFLKKIEELNSNKQIWITHSWGGVLVNAYLTRNPEYIKKVDKIIHFASKRRIATINKQRFFQIILMWGFSFKILSYLYGYLPSKEIKVGSENEPINEYLDTTIWVRKKKWKGIYNEFNYTEKLKTLKLPKSLYVSAMDDLILGNPKDVRIFMDESGIGEREEMILSEKNGNLHNYDHINLLTHKDAPNDHFIKVTEWLKS